MKKLSFLILVTLLFAIFLVGCGPRETYIDMEFPGLDEQVGYRISFLGEYSTRDEEGGKYSFVEGKDMCLEIIAEPEYTLKDMIVKDNGEVIKENSISTSYDYEEKYAFWFREVNKPHTITIEGVKTKVLNVRMERARYIEDDDDTEGIIYDDYESMFITEYNNGTHWGFNDTARSIEKDNLQFAFGETFEIWIGTIYADCYDAWEYKLHVMSADFNGVLKKDNIASQHYRDCLISIKNPVKDENDEYIMKSNMYKFEIEVKQDLVLCFNSIDVEPNVFKVIPEQNSFCSIDIIEGGIENRHREVKFGIPWSFMLHKSLVRFKEEVDPILAEEYAQLYEELEVFINGEEIVADDDGVYTIAGNRPPASFNEGKHDYTTEYIITFNAISLREADLSKYDQLYLKKFKVNTTEGIGETSYSNLKNGEEYYWHFFYDTACEICYYDIGDLNWDKVVIAFKAIEGYDYTDMEIEINNQPINIYDYIELIRRDNKDRWEIIINRESLLDLEEDYFEIDILGITAN